jgi:hypothetical protein
VIHIKCNVAQLGAPLGYAMADGRFEWTGETTLTAADLLASESQGGKHSVGEEAAAFLREVLAGGPVDANVVKAEAKQQGIAERTLQRAKQRLGVQAKKRGFGEGGAWLWSLPPAPATTLRGPESD